MIRGALKRSTAKYLAISQAAKIVVKELLQLLVLAHSTKIKAMIPSPLRNTSTIWSKKTQKTQIVWIHRIFTIAKTIIIITKIIPKITTIIIIIVIHWRATIAGMIVILRILDHQVMLLLHLLLAHPLIYSIRTIIIQHIRRI